MSPITDIMVGSLVADCMADAIQEAIAVPGTLPGPSGMHTRHRGDPVSGSRNPAVYRKLILATRLVRQLRNDARRLRRLVLALTAAPETDHGWRDAVLMAPLLVDYPGVLRMAFQILRARIGIEAPARKFLFLETETKCGFYT